MVLHMMWPLLACFILVGIHAYLGIHVIARKVIFVDLALAQIAALGAVYGVFIGLSFDNNAMAVKLVSVSFTLVGAALVSLTRPRNNAIPHEAIIGIVYAAALSMTVLLTANLPHGADEVRQMLAGSILWVTPREVISTAALYACIGLIHWIFRKQFFALSNEHASGASAGSQARLWDFLFYATFGVVVTSSVGMGGVLLVFGFLIIPSVLGLMLAKKNQTRLIIGWAAGVVASIIGVCISYIMDMPSGPTIVVVLGTFLILTAIYKELIHSATRNVGLLHATFIFVTLLVLLSVPKIFRQTILLQDETHSLDTSHPENIALIKKMLDSSASAELEQALMDIESMSLSQLMPKTIKLIFSDSASVRERAVALQGQMKNYAALDHLKRLSVQEHDDFILMKIAQSLLDLDDEEAFAIIAKLLENSAEFVRIDAFELAQNWIINAPQSIEELKAMLKKFHRFEFDAQTKKYLLK